MFGVYTFPWHPTLWENANAYPFPVLHLFLCALNMSGRETRGRTHASNLLSRWFTHRYQGALCSYRIMATRYSSGANLPVVHMCRPPRVFCIPRLSNSFTSLSILLSMSLVFTATPLLALSRSLFLSLSYLVPLGVAAALAQLSISATCEAFNPYNPAILLIFSLL